jgi:Fe-S cluster assembly iron-binding protein IscA
VGLSLEEPEENDKIEIMNEIKVAIEPDIAPYVDGLTLDFNKQANGLVLLGNESDCC